MGEITYGAQSAFGVMWQAFITVNAPGIGPLTLVSDVLFSFEEDAKKRAELMYCLLTGKDPYGF